jgi:hypothetical protein
LYYYGIVGAYAHWFKTYPTSRKQKVNISPQNQKENSLPFGKQ